MPSFGLTLWRSAVLGCLLACSIAFPVLAGNHPRSTPPAPQLPPSSSPPSASAPSASQPPTTSGSSSRPRSANCPSIYRPVCARRGGRNRTYTNSCHAAANKALVIAQGRCPDLCSKIYQPTCAVDDNGRRHTYSSICEATVAGARFVHAGRCRGR